MTSILLIRLDEMRFDIAAVTHFLSTHNGFQDLRVDEPGGAAVEAYYREAEDWTVVRLSEDAARISLSGSSNAALRAALILQNNLNVPMRMFDTNYSFDLVLDGLSSIEELRDAIDRSQIV